MYVATVQNSYPTKFKRLSIQINYIKNYAIFQEKFLDIFTINYYTVKMQMPVPVAARSKA